ncbi:hypothetical protein EPI10_026767 [Gossypium australe]|uniref:Uncharacterized protein n=1 Tax=Gossypium australe TaxID=47621 RepID=A0A5B6UUE8_9ROSI|nr:hypothetical protein EPI10_026767 [Gossypium australe]
MAALVNLFSFIRGAGDNFSFKWQQLGRHMLADIIRSVLCSIALSSPKGNMASQISLQHF